MMLMWLRVMMMMVMMMQLCCMMVMDVISVCIAAVVTVCDADVAVTVHVIADIVIAVVSGVGGVAGVAAVVPTVAVSDDTATAVIVSLIHCVEHIGNGDFTEFHSGNHWRGRVALRYSRVGKILRTMFHHVLELLFCV